MVPTVEWKDGAVRLLDQSRLPAVVEFLDCHDYQTVADAIRTLKVRGAPAIGVTAAMGVALGAQAINAMDYSSFAQAGLKICDELATTRPTAVTPPNTALQKREDPSSMEGLLKSIAPLPPLDG